MFPVTFHMDEGTVRRYRTALHDAGSPVDAAGVAARFAGLEISRTALELIATAVLGHADNRVGSCQAVPRQMWEDEGYRSYHRQAMRRELHEALTGQGYVPVTLPSETVRYLKMTPPAFGREVPESADWDTAEIALDVPVRTPPVGRAGAVRRGLLAGSP
jgi:hypothetical protein